MNPKISQSVKLNSDEYFSEIAIKDTGFREYDVRWLIDKEINYRGITVLGQAFGTKLQRDYNVDKVVVGNDFRKYSQNVKNAFIVGLLSTGMHIIDVGLCLTPVVYFAQHYLGVKGGGMVTASHNENGWTGVKLGYDLSKTFGPDEIKDLKEMVYKGDFISKGGTYEVNTSIRNAYIDDLVSKAKTKRKLKIVVATGNGTAGIFTPEILKRAGHEIIPLHNNLDWDFPNFNPNPEDIKFLESAGEKVREVGADLAICVDGDGDRIGIVGNDGKEIFSDKIGLFIARNIAKEKPNSTFVVDVKSTGLYAVDNVLKEHNCKTIYWKTGHSYIKSKAQEEKAIAGFEKSGHFFFGSPYGRGYDDANLSAINVCNILSNQDKSITDIFSELPKSYQTPTMSPECDDTKKYWVVDELTKGYKKDLEENKSIKGFKIKELITVNGVRVHFEDGSWGLIRASSNKPVLVIVAESFTTRKRIYDIFDDIQERLSKFDCIGKFDQTLPPYPGEDK